MKKIILSLIVLSAVSCMKDFERKYSNGDEAGRVPADFEWRMIRDVAATVGMPQVDGVAPDFAIIRIYASPLIADGSEIAKGVVGAASPSFSTVFTVPAGVKEVFVRTTLPDGTSSIQTAEVSGGQINLPGAAMKSATATTRAFAEAATVKSSSMPTDFPTIPEKTAADFAASAIISQTPSAMYDLGASYVQWNPGMAVAAEYYIPAGAVIEGNINLSCNQAPYRNPILYVAGTLKLSSNVGPGRLAILPGGKVIVDGQLVAQDNSTPTIYIFKNGTLTAKSANLSCKSVVNKGTFAVEGQLQLNHQLSLYNTAGATLSAQQLIYSNSGGLYNDGAITVGSFDMNSSVDFENCENGVLDFDNMVLEAGNTLVQKGKATIEKMTNRGKVYVNCYTYMDDMSVDGGFVYVASDACLETNTAKFNNAQVNMSPASLFIAQAYNPGGLNGNKFDNNGSGTAVVRFEKTAICANKAKTQFRGPIEVVYDYSQLGDEYRIEEKYVNNFFKSGSYLIDKQMTNIPASECNGGKGVINSKPETEPGEIVTKGALYTYCFEDGWPWICDYDMNDVVMLTSVDRTMSKDGSKVESIRINWEVKASGAKYRLALGVQFDRVEPGQIASVEMTNTFGAGPFSGSGIEAGNTHAVIPLFNSIKETQAAGTIFFNTEKKSPAIATQKNSTTIRFTSAVDAGAVVESAMNMFIVVNQGISGDVKRSVEVHMPGYNPTNFGDVSGYKSILPGSPYKFYAPGDSNNNRMMWGLMIPGEFRYPAESKDIRKVYTYFKAWAVSGGSSHSEWYKEEANDTMLY